MPPFLCRLPAWYRIEFRPFFAAGLIVPQKQVGIRGRREFAATILTGDPVTWASVYGVPVSEEQDQQETNPLSIQLLS